MTYQRQRRLQIEDELLRSLLLVSNHDMDDHDQERKRRRGSIFEENNMEDDHDRLGGCIHDDITIL